MEIGVAAFWISIAAVLIAGGWFKSRTEAQKHETLRRMIDKTGAVDEARLGELFNAAAPPSGWTHPELWRHRHLPGQNYPNARVTGVIVMAGAAALAVCFLILQSTGVNTPRENSIGFAVAAAIAVFGVGLFATSLFVQRPPSKGAEDGDRTAP